MNYYEFYNFPIKFYIDEDLLKKQFYQYSKDFHPDFHALKSEEEQQKMLELSTLNNKAFFVLKSLNTRLEYLLKIKNILVDDEKYSLPPEFLMEMMELNEAWMDAESPEAKQVILDQINTLQIDIYSPIKAYLEASSVESISPEAMLQIKEYYYKKKYLDRILAEFHH